jgi:hypothetical protein
MVGIGTYDYKTPFGRIYGLPTSLPDLPSAPQCRAQPQGKIIMTDHEITKNYADKAVYLSASVVRRRR